MKSARPLLFLVALAACSGDEAPASVVTRPAETPAEAAQAASAEAAQATVILEDLSSFLGDALDPTAALDGLGGSTRAWRGTASCSVELSLTGDSLALEKDCTLPSGRHVSGSLHIQLGGACGLGGLSVKFDLLIEDQPSSGVELHVTGEVALKHDFDRLYVSTHIQHMHRAGGHAVDAIVAGCFVLDRPAQVAALDAVVSVEVDAEMLHLFQVKDLQHRWCEAVPYTGEIRVQHRDEIVSVVFDRESPDTGTVHVTAADGVTHDVDVSASFPVLRCPGTAPAGELLDIDYASCGGCGNPAPGGGGNGDGSGAGGGNGSGGGNGQDDPIVPPDAPDID